MPEDRRLAAIMFTDIVGYTALMGRDEDKAFKVLRKNRGIQRPIIKKYRGEWLKEMGDGILASFSTCFAYRHS
jgi:class 3 adenylate cyclase